MEGLRTMAEAEADEVEREDETGEPETEETPEPEQPPLADAPKEVGETEVRAANKAQEVYRKKLAALLGEEAVAHECLCCTGVGFLPTLPPIGSYAVVTDDDGLGLRWTAPGEPPAFLKIAPDKETCPECDGWGETVTGSKADHHITAQCGKCSGNGYILRARDMPQTFYVPPPQNAAIQTQPAQGNGVPDDPWGRPAGHPHYGWTPASVGAEGS